MQNTIHNTNYNTQQYVMQNTIHNTTTIAIKKSKKKQRLIKIS